ncbi:metal-dependent hydrolase [Enterococcus sp. LJL98]
MEITFHGHSVVAIELKNGIRLLIDPFISGNPVTDLVAEEVQADYVLITHGHNDHVGDMVEIAKKNNAMVISMVEICDFAEKQGVKQTHGMNIGGSFDFPFGRLTLTPAIHSSSYTLTTGENLYMGLAAGLLLEIEGKTIYHAGDTAEFRDMDLLGENAAIDVAFLPIGDNFTMGPKEALRAAQRIKAKRVVPIHYNTFPVIEQDGQAFVDKLPGIGQWLAVGEKIFLDN